MSTDNAVLVTEVSLRDGLQIEPVIVPTGDKVAFAHQLVDAGFTHLEVGAFVNAAKVPTMADSDDVVRRLGAISATLHTLVFNLKGAQRAIASGNRNVRFVVSASDGHSKANAGATTMDALDRIDQAADLLRDNGVGLEATIATAFVCPFDGDTPVERVLLVAERLSRTGITVLHLADTIGAASPRDIRRAVGAVASEYPDLPIGLHLHDTYGMAAANVWEGLRMGVRRFDAALGGLGGCPFAPGASGNIGADDLVHFLHREGLTTGIQPDRLAAARHTLAGLVGHPLDSSLARAGKPPAALRIA